MPEHQRADRSREQEVDQRAVELLQEARQRMARPSPWERVGTEGGEPLGGLARGQSLAPALERLEDLGGRACMPVYGGLFAGRR
jgi:hypothetical protein